MVCEKYLYKLLTNQAIKKKTSYFVVCERDVTKNPLATVEFQSVGERGKTHTSLRRFPHFSSATSFEIVCTSK